MIASAKTHRAYSYFLIGAYGERRGPFVKQVHVSRRCENCAHNGPGNAEWLQAVAAGEELSTCMSDCWAADAADEGLRFCDDHQSLAEFETAVHRADRPVFVLVRAE